MDNVIIGLALTGVAGIGAACIYMIFVLKTVHKLVNSRLTEALQRIDKLEGLLTDAGQPVPPLPIRRQS